MRERQYLKRAGRHPVGHLPGEVSARLVAAMLAEAWIYREDGDGYRLEADEALAFQGGTAWRITPHGRWAALTVRQRKLLAELGESSVSLTRGDVRAAELVQVHLVEPVDEVLRLTVPGDTLVRAFGRGVGQPSRRRC
ncbi:hypothetical protein ACIQVO_38605 [Streptomyces sp. NPDC101062]|uniref:hypothetical protein n=1 Tax=unclassified Streptomyces TaxID=2593676 RepID=UPI0038288612